MGVGACVEGVMGYILHGMKGLLATATGDGRGGERGGGVSRSCGEAVGSGEWGAWRDWANKKEGIESDEI
jgi:hypothetical protein